MSAPTLTFLSLKQAAASLGPRKSGRPAAEDTVREWCLRGLRGVKLRSEVRGQMRLTTAEWLQDFFRDVEIARGHAPAPPSPTARKREVAAAQAQLRKQGLLK